MTAFAAATDALFADPNVGRDVSYLPGGLGPAQTVRGVIGAPDDTTAFSDTVLHSGTLFLRVRVSEVPGLAGGDHLIVDAATYVVQKNPRRDTLNLTWRAVLVPEALA